MSEDILWIEKCIIQAEKDGDTEMVNYFIEMLDRLTEVNG